MRVRHPDPQAGFSLVEVLVAFTILSVTIIAGLNILGDGVRQTGQVEKRLEILAAAKKELTRIEAGAPAGVDAGPRLRVSMTPLGGNAGEPGVAQPQVVRIWAADGGSAPLLTSIFILPQAPL
jgi:prepilin-type N-terminal cleavage/methylation domain-containing protein